MATLSGYCRWKFLWQDAGHEHLARNMGTGHVKLSFEDTSLAGLFDPFCPSLFPLVKLACPDFYLLSNTLPRR